MVGPRHATYPSWAPLEQPVGVQRGMGRECGTEKRWKYGKSAYIGRGYVTRNLDSVPLVHRCEAWAAVNQARRHSTHVIAARKLKLPAKSTRTHSCRGCTALAPKRRRALHNRRKPSRGGIACCSGPFANDSLTGGHLFQLEPQTGYSCEPLLTRSAPLLGAPLRVRLGKRNDENHRERKQKHQLQHRGNVPTSPETPFRPMA